MGRQRHARGRSGGPARADRVRRRLADPDARRRAAHAAAVHRARPRHGCPINTFTSTRTSSTMFGFAPRKSDQRITPSCTTCWSFIFHLDKRRSKLRTRCSTRSPDSRPECRLVSGRKATHDWCPPGRSWCFKCTTRRTARSRSIRAKSAWCSPTRAVEQKEVHMRDRREHRLSHPAGRPELSHVRPATSSSTTRVLHSVMPHMHFRGKSFRFTAEYPDGRKEILLDVPRYDFNWQNVYTFARAQAHAQGHGDHLRRPLRQLGRQSRPIPIPTQEVRWGDQTWEEMMLGVDDRQPARQREAWRVPESRTHQRRRFQRHVSLPARGRMRASSRPCISPARSTIGKRRAIAWTTPTPRATTTRRSASSRASTNTNSSSTARIGCPTPRIRIRSGAYHQQRRPRAPPTKD